MTAKTRAPFDDADRERVSRYFTETERYLVDPHAHDPASDPYYLPSLTAIQQDVEGVFSAVRADGATLRVYPAFFEWSVPKRFAARAFAKDLGDLHLCAVETGLVSITFELACFSFSQAGFFKEVGNAAAEESPALPDNADLGYWIADRVISAFPENTAPIGEELIPLDPERRLIAHFLSQLMLRFVWLHELFHGMNGHSGWLESKRKEAELTDVTELPLVEIEPDDEGGLAWSERVQLFEFDADRAAFATMIRMQLGGAERFEALGSYPENFRLKLVLLAAMMMTFLFAQSDKRRHRESAGSHPAAQRRLHNLLGTVASHFDEGEGRMTALLAEIFVEMQGLQTRIPALVTFDQVKADLATPAALQELDKLEADLERMRVECASFAFRQPQK